MKNIYTVSLPGFYKRGEIKKIEYFPATGRDDYGLGSVKVNDDYIQQVSKRSAAALARGHNLPLK